ncbi:MAG: NAD-dependent protein deacylase [Planctomycetaceae bacterium]|nr:NAD-dependent protein deacylase [Planctomycetaceae bacterium]
MPHIYEQQLTKIAELLRQAKRVLFITGAGISADSGLPTYRGVGGLYNKERTEDGYAIEDCLSRSMFDVRPEITWKYMLQIGIAVAEHQPNDAHRIIAKWEQQFAQRGGKVVVLTQNIDGYHRVAGSKNVYEFHGSFGTLECTECSWTESFEMGDDIRERLKQLCQTLPPKCPQCKAVIRPRVIMFEEMLPRQTLMQFEKEFDNGRGFDLVFTIGTSAMFPYITAPIHTAASKGIPTVEINPADSALPNSVEIHLQMRAAEALREIDKR